MTADGLIPVRCRECGRVMAMFTRFALVQRPVTLVCAECGQQRVWAPAPLSFDGGGEGGQQEDDGNGQPKEADALSGVGLLSFPGGKDDGGAGGARGAEDDAS